MSAGGGAEGAGAEEVHYVYDRPAIANKLPVEHLDLLQLGLVAAGGLGAPEHEVVAPRVVVGQTLEVSILAVQAFLHLFFPAVIGIYHPLISREQEHLCYTISTLMSVGRLGKCHCRPTFS